MNSKELIFEVFERMFEPTTFDQAIRPMMIVNLISGIGCFKDSNNRLYKCLEYIYTGLYMLFFFHVCYYTSVYFKNMEANADYFLNRELFHTSYFLNGLMAAALITVTRIKAKKIRTMMALFNDYDQTMKKIGLPKQYHSIYLFQLYYFGMGTTIIIVCSALLVLCTTGSLVKRICYVLYFNYAFVVINACNTSFCVWIRYLRLRFEQLNGLLKSIRTKQSDVLQEKKIMRISYDLDNKLFDPFDDEDVRRNKKNAMTMSIVKRSHLELFKIANVASTTYGLQLLMLMITAYIFLISLFYACYRVVWLHSTLDTSIAELASTLSVPMSILIFFGYQIFITSHNCGKVNSEAVVTGEIICKLYGSYACQALRAEIRNFTLQLVQNPLTFTVYGLFTVDSSFFFRVIQSISTYLVILIQVGDTVIDSVRTLNNRNYTAAVESL